MGILSNIFAKIFPSSHPAVVAQATPGAQTSGASTAGTAATGAPATAAISEVDVESILNGKAVSAGETLNWRTSIVDLMKLLGIDSSLQSRKELATELHYSGDMNDSASMNIWLHKQVMSKLAANGGKVPADLL
jgi:hypothetical protein